MHDDDFEVSVPNGTLLVHIVRCMSGMCWRIEEISGTGDGFKHVTREKASEHARETGHEVQFIHGTIETMVPLRTKEKS